ncbi:MAG: DUF2752 domain-containing protein [Prevotellaceae bacterium]|jgi:hypothetical protein|nr:DUF2752 domain-containing protein [Prevotellaceae bacterium]
MKVLQKYGQYVQRIYFVGLLILPIFLFFVPIDWLSRQHSICLIKNILGIECWGCGITKSVICAVQFDYVAAFQYNKLIIIVFPILVYVWIKQIIKIIAVR